MSCVNYGLNRRYRAVVVFVPPVIAAVPFPAANVYGADGAVPVAAVKTA
jgi:hypothetical protein